MNHSDADYQPTYNDSADQAQSDVVTHDLTDDPAEELGVPPEELRDELSRFDGEASAKPNPAYDEDDAREHMEDIDDIDEIDQSGER